ncbi:MAG: hypothetical protein HQL79_03980 [Magnetococcales bacterium]|nr:hypothetical protein [Magnetococcales bacterium]
MAFVNELIPDEDKLKLEAMNIRYPHYRKLSLTKGSIWTIDHDRNIYLLPTAFNMYDAPGLIYFVLSWKDKIIGIKALDRSTKNEDQIYTVFYTILKLQIPGEILCDREHIMNAIVEALDIYTRNTITIGNRPAFKFGTVYVSFSEKME